MPFTFRILPGKVKTIGRAPPAPTSSSMPGWSRACTAGWPRRATELEVVDLDSTNGTYVNGVRVAQALLKEGDELGVGRVTFRVCRTES